MRHEAAGITTAAFPKTLRLGGIDCSATYLHEPGDAKDGLTVQVPIYALNQVSEERCEWLVPGMLQAKVLALCKTLHQRPRSRLVPLPDFAAEFCATVPDSAQGGLLEALLKAVRERTQLAVQRNDFKLEQLPPHLFMNFRVLDEHGRQLAQGRDLASLKAELGSQARSAFQALAALKLRTLHPAGAAQLPAPAGQGRARGHRTAASPGGLQPRCSATPPGPLANLPELLEVRRGNQVLVGYPALIDVGDAVQIEVFDEPDVAAVRHLGGLRRLLALQLREPLKFLERNIPELTRMAAAYMALGTLEELREQIIEVALQRAFLAEPLPTDEELPATAGGRPTAAEPDCPGGGAPGRRGAGRACGRCCASSRTASPPRTCRTTSPHTAAAGGQALPAADAMACAACTCHAT
jgi:ATP-dependent helicase HrpA